MQAKRKERKENENRNKDFKEMADDDNYVRIIRKYISLRLW